MAKKFSAQLFVSRLSAYTTDRSLRQLFSPFGQIKEARLIRDPKTQRPKGFGFVTFQSEDDARKALKSLDGKIVDGRLIFVEVAKNAEEVTTNMSSKKTEDRGDGDTTEQDNQVDTRTSNRIRKPNKKYF